MYLMNAALIQQFKWRDRAICSLENVSTDVFFPPTRARNAYKEAHAICVRCPVKAECLKDNINEPDGYFGDTTPKERRRVRRMAVSGLITL